MKGGWHGEEEEGLGSLYTNTPPCPHKTFHHNNSH